MTPNYGLVLWYLRMYYITCTPLFSKVCHLFVPETYYVNCPFSEKGKLQPWTFSVHCLLLEIFQCCWIKIVAGMLGCYLRATLSLLYTHCWLLSLLLLAKAAMHLYPMFARHCCTHSWTLYTIDRGGLCSGEFAEAVDMFLCVSCFLDTVYPSRLRTTWGGHCPGVLAEGDAFLCT